MLVYSVRWPQVVSRQSTPRRRRAHIVGAESYPHLLQQFQASRFDQGTHGPVLQYLKRVERRERHKEGWLCSHDNNLFQIKYSGEMVS